MAAFVVLETSMVSAHTLVFTPPSLLYRSYKLNLNLTRRNIKLTLSFYHIGCDNTRTLQWSCSKSKYVSADILHTNNQKQNRALNRTYIYCSKTFCQKTIIFSDIVLLQTCKNFSTLASRGYYNNVIVCCPLPSLSLSLNFVLPEFRSWLTICVFPLVSSNYQRFHVTDWWSDWNRAWWIINIRRGK